MTDLLSSLLTSAVFVIWCVLSAYHWHLFPVFCLELFSKKKPKTNQKRKGVEAEAWQEEWWAFPAFAGKLGVLAGGTGATWLGCKPLCSTELSR